MDILERQSKKESMALQRPSLLSGPQIIGPLVPIQLVIGGKSNQIRDQSTYLILYSTLMETI
jgi:hypothetical protein